MGVYKSVQRIRRSGNLHRTKTIPGNFKACLVPVIKNVEEKSTVKNFYPVSLHSMVSKIFKKIVSNRRFDHLEKCGLFLFSGIVSGFLDQLQIFWQLYLIELLELLTGLGLLEL